MQIFHQTFKMYYRELPASIVLHSGQFHIIAPKVYALHVLLCDFEQINLSIQIKI